VDLLVNRDSEHNIGSISDGLDSTDPNRETLVTDPQSYKLTRGQTNSGPGSRPDTPVGERVETTDFEYSKPRTIDLDRQEADGWSPVRKPKKPIHNFMGLNLKNDLNQA
jgi:hypothetical protein